MVDRDRRLPTHRDHSVDRMRTRTPVVTIPPRQKARTIEPPMRPVPRAPDFDDELTPVDSIMDRIVARGAFITKDLRLAVETLLEHTERSERRSADRILASHQSALQGSPPPSRWDRIVGVAKWLGPLVLALASAIYAAGVRQGASGSERRQLDEVIRSVRQLELDVSNLRGAVRALRTGGE